MQKSTNKADHILSFLLSLIINSLLVLLLLSTLDFKSEINHNKSFATILENIEPIAIQDPTDYPIIEGKNIESTDDLYNTYENIPTPTITIDDLTTINQQENVKLNDIIPTVSDITLPLFVNTGVKDAITDSVIKFGGPKGEVGQTSVNKALQWLKNNQSENGGWTLDGIKGKECPGHTGLAILAFLAHGETPSSKEYGSTVAKGIRWLVENQNDKGIIGQSQHTSYGHAMATYAMAEAYSVTSNPLLENPLIKAANVILEGIQPNGGFDYNYAISGRNDSSVAGWNIQALKAVSIAIPKDIQYVQKLNLAMNGMLNNSTLREGKRTIGYTSKGNNLNITAAGTLGMIFTGRIKERETKELMESLSHISPEWNNASIYLWYYTSQAKFHFEKTSKDFQDFNSKMIMTLSNNQNKDGSWDEPSGGGVKGRTGTTAMSALSLMVYYRNLPTLILKSETKTSISIDEDVVKFHL